MAPGECFAQREEIRPGMSPTGHGPSCRLAMLARWKGRPPPVSRGSASLDAQFVVGNFPQIQGERIAARVPVRMKDPAAMQATTLFQGSPDPGAPAIRNTPCSSSRDGGLARQF